MIIIAYHFQQNNLGPECLHLFGLEYRYVDQVLFFVFKVKMITMKGTLL